MLPVNPALDETLLDYLLQSEPVFETMRQTVENSAYHREKNVLVHTLMVCDWYRKNTPIDMPDFGLGLFSCLLHDVAKPSCRTPKTAPGREKEFGYPRHEQEGAIMAEDILVRAGVSEFDIYRICWMIEHHLDFWTVADLQKRQNLAQFMKQHQCFLPFKFFMLADDFGRICDERKINSWDFFDQFERKFMSPPDPISKSIPARRGAC